MCMLILRTSAVFTIKFSGFRQNIPETDISNLQPSNLGNKSIRDMNTMKATLNEVFLRVNSVRPHITWPDSISPRRRYTLSRHLINLNQAS